MHDLIVFSLGAICAQAAVFYLVLKLFWTAGEG